MLLFNNLKVTNALKAEIIIWILSNRWWWIHSNRWWCFLWCTFFAMHHTTTGLQFTDFWGHLWVCFSLVVLQIAFTVLCIPLIEIKLRPIFDKLSNLLKEFRKASCFLWWFSFCSYSLLFFSCSLCCAAFSISTIVRQCHLFLMRWPNVHLVRSNRYFWICSPLASSTLLFVRDRLHCTMSIKHYGSSVTLEIWVYSKCTVNIPLNNMEIVSQ